VIALAEIGPEDILIYIHKRGEARYTDLFKSFVESGKCAKQTFINYKKQLEASGKIKKKISEKTNRAVYYVPDEVKKEVEKLIAIKEINEDVEKIDLDVILKLKKEIKRLQRDLRIRELEELPLFWSQEYTPSEIEIREVSWEEYQSRYLGDPGWHVLDYDLPENKAPPEKVRIGAYKELLKLREERFEDLWSEWKEQHHLTEEDKRLFGPTIREMLNKRMLITRALHEILVFLEKSLNNLKSKNKN